ncbi:MAG: glutamate formimidoyltransferase [Candidatus Rokuibacteriota bacterium]|nr:MAG: glutamate formimidoyltransferase [Candidatus Rokubacteria bacterium]
MRSIGGRVGTGQGNNPSPGIIVRVTGPVLECVPNVSEGRDARVIDRIARAISDVAGIRLADVHADSDHHRSVFTVLGAPDAVERAAWALAAATFASVDMRSHHGVHRRLGALDVLPFIPLRHVTMDEAAARARRVGEGLGRTHGVPVFFYGAAATSAARRSLPVIRAGEYEGLSARLADRDWQPDAGPARFDAVKGACVVGARGILVAYNVWLDSTDVNAARAIARAIRESSGGLPGLQAMGVPLHRHGVVQVSMNLVDYRVTSVARAFDAVAREADRIGIRVKRGELVGLLPRAALEGRTPESAGLGGLKPEQYLETHLDALP